jgi:DNA mismatch endonuclease (patch repair protein)
MRRDAEIVSDATMLLRRPPAASSPAAAAVMQGNRSRDTAPEVALRRILHARGLRYRTNAAVVRGVRCRADVLFARNRVAVFVDGCFWHRCPIHSSDPKANASYWQAKFDRNVSRDRANDAALAEAGWTVVRVWEHEDPSEAADRIEIAVRESARPRAEG